MKKLFALADQYCRESNWKTLAAFKFCLLSLGMIIGMLLPQSAKPIAFVLCAAVFCATYIPLMAKLFKIWKKS